ncbi:putative DNA-binding protein [Arcticibacter svalbardensis MN12-7]|uniref:UPF0251 protein ADIARSV_3454 n=1 Tax=Arcticibacter svalbardensis MN12-7 TaxID=1150600 RepID=R9GPA4_9SPHI|nr:DUF134 domain-containing protein [Arcticibacter svalbardensis]EOR93375.1 putative DNA-binding protein [Arcticibacter svalbardensis MN12-7]
MARLKKSRVIQRAPSFLGFKPFGVQKLSGEDVILHLEEYESVKLCDYENLTHEQAAKIMNVSRPTFSRVYQSARNKIAKAFVEASSILLEGGNSVVGILWYSCPVCELNFSSIIDEQPVCPFCLSEHVCKVDEQ